MKPAQKVTLGVVIAAASVPLIVRLYRRVRCALRGHHDPLRQPLGGFRCTACGLAGDTLGDLGFDGSYVSLGPRKVFDRTSYGGELTRTTAYEKTARGW